MDWQLPAFVFLVAGLIVVPIARRVGLGSVLGYLVAGALIGPSGLGLVGNAEDVMHFAEFGVVMMLFLVGLELDPGRLWRLRGPIVGLGGLQVLVTAVVVAVPAMGFGLAWQPAVALGLVLAMSSTAIGLQSLQERGLSHSDAGQKAFSVLLFQDIAVIPMLAVFPLLATYEVHHAAADAHGGAGPLDGLAAPVRAVVVLGGILAVVVAGRFLVRPMMRVIARTGLRELFTASALAIVIGVTLLMSVVGLSPALGTFIAGVVLANSEYRHELESDVEPFKGLLLGLFFLAVGATVDFAMVAASPGPILGALVGVSAAKLLVLLALVGWRGAKDQAVWFAASLFQVGEFAFVLLNFAAQSGVLPEDLARRFVAVTALSMAASPLVLAFAERVVLPRVTGRAATDERAPDVVDEENAVLIAGYGRFGQITGRFLRASGVGATVLDVDGEQIDIVRRFGQKVHYGDASRLDLLRAAGAEKAKVLVVAVDDHDKAVQIVDVAKKHFPHLQIVARARGRSEAYDLLERDIAGVYRETFDTALRVGQDVRHLLGHPAHAALRSARTFRRYDESGLRAMAAVRHDQVALQTTARDRIRELEEILGRDQGDAARALDDDAWDAEPLREASRTAVRAAEESG
jgi:CPA2 family monovalent cation:H+ antiporter-2